MTPRRRRIKFWRWARKRCLVLPEELIAFMKLKPVPKYFHRDPILFLWYSDSADFSRRVDEALESFATAFMEAEVIDLFKTSRVE